MSPSFSRSEKFCGILAGIDENAIEPFFGLVLNGDKNLVMKKRE
jgi:hypothetical protein